MNALSEIFRDESYPAIRDAQTTKPTMDARRKADSCGYDEGMAGEKIDANPYEETDELHWIWLRGWVSAGLAKHCPSNAQVEARRQ